MIPFLNGGEICFLTDKVTFLKTLAAQQYLTDENVNVFNDWPAQSLDINSIDQMWTELKDKFSFKECTNC